jgi:hypothetical protein
MPDWPRLFSRHRAAVAAYAERASAIPPGRWDTPRAPGKWTPAQETEHVRLAYQLMVRACRDGYRARPMVSRVWARLLRWTILPLIRTGRWFPEGARAPRDARPASAPGPRDTLIAALRAQAAEWEGVVATLAATDPGRSAFHPYFGEMNVHAMLEMSVGHTRHHLRHLEEIPS